MSYESVDSIRPGIVFHTLVDSVGFLWGIFRLEDLQRIMEYSLIDQGLTPGYRVLLTVTLILTVSTLLALAALHRAVRRDASGEASSAD